MLYFDYQNNVYIFVKTKKNVAMKNILYYPIVVLLLCVSCVNQIGSDDVEISIRQCSYFVYNRN